MRNLLSTSAKTAKGDNGLVVTPESPNGFTTAVMYLAPADLSGVNLCGPAVHTAGLRPACFESCLNVSGRSLMDSKGGQDIAHSTIINARIGRARQFLTDRPGFVSQLTAEVDRHIGRALRAGVTPVARFNGTSDLDWIAILGPDTFDRWVDSGLRPYEYTKSARRALASALATKGPRARYPHVYSIAGDNPQAVSTAQDILRAGGRAALVLRCEHTPRNLYAKHPACDCGQEAARMLSATYVNGDAHDLRFLDPAGGLCILRPKARARFDDRFPLDLDRLYRAVRRYRFVTDFAALSHTA